MWLRLCQQNSQKRREFGTGKCVNRVKVLENKSKMGPASFFVRFFDYYLLDSVVVVGQLNGQFHTNTVSIDRYLKN